MGVTTTRTEVDPITVEVIHNYLLSTAREMNRNLVRTSFNTIIYEVHDFGLAIYDRKLRMIAEAPGLAVFTRGNDYAMHKMVDHLGEENIHPGDLILLNYPYWSSHHTLDVMASSPIFHRDRLIGFTAVKIHWLDLGQKDPGYVLDSTSIFQEGLMFPCSKIYKEGVLNTDLEELIRFNSRIPDRVIGDMNAQISSCRTGERRVQELVEKFGPDTFEAAVDEILDHGERLMRARLAQLPKGTWTAVDYADDDGIEKDRLVKIQVTVTISDDEVLIDFTGSHPETKGPINIPIGCTIGVAALVFKSLTTPDTPANEGNFRALRVEAPPGCVMHAVPPAPTFTLWTALLAVDVVMKAFAQGMPDAIPACSGGDIFSVLGVGVDPVTGKMWVESSNEGVGFGGHVGGDGDNGLMHMTEPGCRNNPIEVLESKAPLLVEDYKLIQDSGGAGRHRGGLGLQRTYRFLADASALTLVKKTKTAPWGSAGGEEGDAGYVTLRPGTDREERTGMVYESMAPGDVLVNHSGGGGGWGDPTERDPAAVLADVVNEYVSIHAAREDYGVVIDVSTMTVDTDATAVLRAQR
jgi:N-methylhydantoinase B